MEIEEVTGRIAENLEHLKRYTATPGDGCTRLPFTKEAREAAEYLKSLMTEAGLEVREDAAGNVIGVMKGEDPALPCVMMGSHYDSVVNGGAFDGAAGTVAALEVMRVLTEEQYENDYPMELILMNAEEGATFGPCTGVTNSRAMVGTLTMKELNTVKNRFGQTKLEAMKEYGLNPDLKSCIRRPGSIKNFVEMHIEQGPVLDREQTEIGLIEYLAGIGRYTVRFYGKTGDSTAPMDSRKDALVAAAAFIQEFDRQIKALGPDVTGMVGKLDIAPNSNQFVPEYAEGKIEIRTFRKEIIETTDFKQLIQNILDKVSWEYHINCHLEEICRIHYPNPTGPSVMNAENVEKMKSICKDLGYSYLVINTERS